MQNEACTLAISQGFRIFATLVKFRNPCEILQGYKILQGCDFSAVVFLLFYSEFCSSQIVSHVIVTNSYIFVILVAGVVYKSQATLCK